MFKQILKGSDDAVYRVLKRPPSSSILKIPKYVSEIGSVSKSSYRPNNERKLFGKYNQNNQFEEDGIGGEARGKETTRKTKT
jgi:hypothetical protein